jgi:hypothetical protein
MYVAATAPTDNVAEAAATSAIVLSFESMVSPECFGCPGSSAGRREQPIGHPPDPL